MRDDLEPTVLTQLKTLSHRLHRVPAVGVSSDVLIYTLNTYFEPCTPISEHVVQVGFQAIVRSGLQCDGDALRFALLTIQDSLFHAARGVPTQCIMEVPDEIVPVLLIEGHEGTPHDDEFNLIRIMPQALQLFDTVLRLQIGIISCANRAHRSRLISGVRLRRVFEIGIWPTWTVDANVPGHGNMRATMGLAHDGYYCNARSSSHGFTLEKRGQLVFVGIWQGRKYVYDLRHALELVFR